MQGVTPPPSKYPLLAGSRRHADGKLLPDLVEAHKQAMGMPTLPGLRATAPEPGFIMPVLDYDWGAEFNAMDASGVPSNAVPRIKQVIKMLVPRVDADGNEVGGVPHVLLDAPLGTYLGWNITAGGARPFHQGQICNYTGGMLPFAKTRAEREANQDPRASLQERYGSHDGYVAAVRKAAAHAVALGFLLPNDAQALVAEADASAVLR